MKYGITDQHHPACKVQKEIPLILLYALLFHDSDIPGKIKQQ